MKQFYAYLYIRERNGAFPAGTPYYAGKGHGKRAFHSPTHAVKPPKNRSCILIFNRGSEQEAFETEKELIRNWGRVGLGTGCLYNQKDGGDGSSGYRHSSESLQKMSAVWKTRTISKTWVERLQAARLRGHKHSEDSRKKIGEANRRRTLSQESRDKISNSLKGKTTWNKGRKHTAEAKQKIRDAHLGMKMPPRSAEYREKVSKRLKGKPKSFEHRQRMSEVRIGISNWTPERRRKHSERMSGSNNPNFKR